MSIEGSDQSVRLGKNSEFGIHFHYSGSLTTSEATEYLRKRNLIGQEDEVVALADGSKGGSGHQHAHVAITRRMRQEEAEVKRVNLDDVLGRLNLKSPWD